MIDELEIEELLYDHINNVIVQDYDVDTDYYEDIVDEIYDECLDMYIRLSEEYGDSEEVLEDYEFDEYLNEIISDYIKDNDIGYVSKDDDETYVSKDDDAYVIWAYGDPSVSTCMYIIPDIDS